MRNLHPGVNLHPGCKFAPGVYFWSCERCCKNLHPGANLLLPSRWCKFIWTRVQICTPVQIVHMNANCIISIHFDWRLSINGRHFLLRCCLKSIKNKFQILLYRKEYHVYYFNQTSTRYMNLYGNRRSTPPIHTFFGIQTPGAVARLVACPLCMQTVQIQNLESVFPGFFPLTLI